MTDPTGSTSYIYDPAGNLTSIAHPTGDTVSYTYDLAGRRSQITYPDGSSVNYTYNDLGQPKPPIRQGAPPPTRIPTDGSTHTPSLTEPLAATRIPTDGSTHTPKTD